MVARGRNTVGWGIPIMLPAATVYPIALVCAVLSGWHGVARRLPAAQIAARVLLALYLGWLIGATLFPLPLEGVAGRDGLNGYLNHPNVVPFSTIRETLALPDLWPRVRLLGGNVLVFAPLGLLLPAIWPRFAGPGSIALAGLAVSLSIELTQLAVSLALGTWYRMSDVDDVLLNVAGVLLGYGLAVTLRRASSRFGRFQTPARSSGTPRPATSTKPDIPATTPQRSRGEVS